jgi:hypothetical protein
VCVDYSYVYLCIDIGGSSMIVRNCVISLSLCMYVYRVSLINGIKMIQVVEEVKRSIS